MAYRMKYHHALFGVAWVQKFRGQITQDQFNSVAVVVATYKDGDTDDVNNPSTPCGACEVMTYNAAVDAGQITIAGSSSTTLKSINWANLLAFIQALLPIILQFIQIINPPKPVPTPSLVAGNGE